MMAEETVLLVDDEERLLAGLRRQLRGKFEVVTAVGGAQAMEILESKSEIAVVISDMHMPGMTGVEVLEAFSKKSPTTTRIMLTGNADQDCAVEAINKSHVFGFLNKPCSTDMLIESIEGGLDYHRSLVREKKLIETTLAGSIKLLSDVVSLMDPAATSGCRKVSRWAGILAPHLTGVARWEIDFASMLAPIGRVSVPFDILARHSKAESLSDAELAVLASAPAEGSRLLNNIPRMSGISKAVLYQDKNYDGSGFPADEIKEKDIPIISRLLRILKVLAEIAGDNDLTDDHLNKLTNNKEWFDPEILQLAREHLIKREMGIEQGQEEVENNDQTIGVADKNAKPKEEPIILEIKTGTLHRGKTLAEDFYNVDGALLLSKGTVLSQSQVDKLQSMLRLEKVPRRIKVYN
jgi:response regulator RpfG family c-di-GMP phosphodiesterase